MCLTAAQRATLQEAVHGLITVGISADLLLQEIMNDVVLTDLRRAVAADLESLLREALRIRQGARSIGPVLAFLRLSLPARA
jgi:hypothetical protein